jgi:hypothetical protein
MDVGHCINTVHITTGIKTLDKFPFHLQRGYKPGPNTALHRDYFIYANMLASAVMSQGEKNH